MSGTTEQWFAELGKAADDLGYLVEEVRASEIRLRPKDRADIIVEISSDTGYYPIIAATMRDLLVPRPAKK
jgi:hypothetical protein